MMDRNVYIAIMDKALACYSKEQIDAYFARVREGGMTEHGFPRLTANLGILIAHGRYVALLPMFLEMMDLCCAEFGRSAHAANDFSVKEIIFALLEMERSGIVPRARTEAWCADIARLDPWRGYDCVAAPDKAEIGNWATFNALSEFMRYRIGLVSEKALNDFLDNQMPSQLAAVNARGLYRDPNNPFVYDIVPRGLFAVMLFLGYNGKYAHEMRDALLRSRELTLRYQSVSGEIPFGGRSAQFLHNEVMLAVLYEYYATDARRSGDPAAGQYKAAAELACNRVLAEFDAFPGRHIKNRYPTETKFGCESYAYFDKYMITVASFAYAAYLMADEEIAATACPATSGAHMLHLDDEFHKLFIKRDNYFLEFDTDADMHYDASGLGRIHYAGAPSALALSCPIAKEPYYHLLHPNATALAYAGGVQLGESWYTGADAHYTVTELRETEEASYAVLCAELPCGETVTERYMLTADGLLVTAEGKEGQGVCYELPAFAFDGEERSEIVLDEHGASVSCRGWQVRYETDGMLVDTGETLENRNGEYRHLRAVGQGMLSVRIAIVRI